MSEDRNGPLTNAERQRRYRARQRGEAVPLGTPGPKRLENPLANGGQTAPSVEELAQALDVPVATLAAMTPSELRAVAIQALIPPEAYTRKDLNRIGTTVLVRREPETFDVRPDETFPTLTDGQLLGAIWDELNSKGSK